jgi:hypothetical protein
MQLATNQGFAPVTLDEAMRFSEMLSKARWCPRLIRASQRMFW